MNLFLRSAELRAAMGRNGLKYFQKNYTWDVIEKKYLNILDILEKENG